MKVLFIAVLLSFAISHAAEARYYYKSEISVTLSKSSADAGTTAMPGEYKATLTFSDDQAYCSIRVDAGAYDCKALPTGVQGTTFLTLPKEFYQNALVALGTAGNVLDTLENQSFLNTKFAVTYAESEVNAIDLNPVDPTYSYHLSIVFAQADRL